VATVAAGTSDLKRTDRPARPSGGIGVIGRPERKELIMKKAYTAPTLTTFGAVEALTETIGGDCSRVVVSWDDADVA